MSNATNLSIQQIPVPSLIVNHLGEIIEINEAAEHLTGYSDEEIHGQTVELLVGSDFKLAHVRHRELYDGSLGIMTSIRKVELQTKYSQVLMVNIRIVAVANGYLVMLYENDQVIENLQHSTLAKTH